METPHQPVPIVYPCLTDAAEVPLSVFGTEGGPLVQL